MLLKFIIPAIFLIFLLRVTFDVVISRSPKLWCGAESDAVPATRGYTSVAVEADMLDVRKRKLREPKRIH